MSEQAKFAEESKLNEQAVGVATTVLSEPVLAACCCSQTSEVQAAQRGMGMSRFTQVTQGYLNRLLPSRGLPRSVPQRFLMAVTDGQLWALEQKRKGGNLVAGEKLASWNRADVIAKPSLMGAMMGNAVPEDRQQFALFLPFERRGRPQGKFPHDFFVGKDPASQAVLDALVGQQVLAGAEAAQKMIADRGL
jgi:hypothetical protein